MQHEDFTEYDLLPPKENTNNCLIQFGDWPINIGFQLLDRLSSVKRVGITLK